MIGLINYYSTDSCSINRLQQHTEISPFLFVGYTIFPMYLFIAKYLSPEVLKIDQLSRGEMRTNK
jgi:hypothetical protein